MATYEELIAQSEQLKQQAEAVRLQEKIGVIAELKDKIARFGISAKDLALTSATRQSRSASATRYRSPNGELWSGKGRRPEWLRQAMAQGRNKSDFAI